MKLPFFGPDESLPDRTGWAQVVCVTLFVVSEAALTARLYLMQTAPPTTLRWPFILLVALPFLLSVILAIAVSARRARIAFELYIPFLDDDDDDSSALWRQVATAVKETWDYEKARMVKGLDRVRLSAFVFGTIPSVLLALCALLASWSSSAPGFNVDKVRLFALGVGTSILTTHLLHFGGLVVRISSSDINSRMFTWSLRSTILVAFAASGLMLAFGTGGTNVVGSWSGAALLGILIAALGDRAIPLLVDKSSAFFGVKLPVRDETYSLRTIDGITDADIDRLAEDGVSSVHDLAFASTARLFFSTTQSLARICDWQDQALLRVYMGPVRAKALADAMALRGAIDLQGMAQIAMEDLLPTTEPQAHTPTTPPSPAASLLSVVSTASGTGTAAPPLQAVSLSPPSAATPPPPPAGAQAMDSNPLKEASTSAADSFPNLATFRKDIRQALGKVLGLEGAPLLAALLSLRHDEAILRVRVYWQSTPKPGPLSSAPIQH